MGIKFVLFNRRESRRSLAIFVAEEIAHLGALKIARFCGGAVKIAAATAENRAILVDSAAFSERFFKNWGGPRAPDNSLREVPNRTLFPLVIGRDIASELPSGGIALQVGIAEMVSPPCKP